MFVTDRQLLNVYLIMLNYFSLVAEDTFESEKFNKIFNSFQIDHQFHENKIKIRSDWSHIQYETKYTYLMQKFEKHVY